MCDYWGSVDTMRSLYAVFVCFIALSICLSCGSFVVSATSLEDPTLPDQEVGVSDSSSDQEQEEPTVSDDTSDDSGIAAFAATSESGFDGLASWSLSTNLGSITLIAPKDTNSSGIRIVDDSLVNYNNATVYFYCPEYPSYTFSASRFSPVYYRSESGYNSTLLTINTIEVESVNFLDYYDYIVVGLLLCIFVFVLWRCIFK